MPDTPLPSPLAAVLLLLVACLTIMVGCVIVPGVEQAAAGLEVGSPGWLVTLPALGVILGSPLAGRLIDRRGAYLTLAMGLAAYGLLGAAGPLLSGPVPVYLDRLLLGVATACVMTGGTTLIARLWREPAARLRMIARQGMAIELGGVVFLALGGWLAILDWRAPFLLYLLAWPLLGLQLARLPRPGAGAAQGDGATGPTRRPLGLLATAAASMLIFFVGVLGLPVRLGAAGLDSAGIGLFLSFTSLVAVGAAAQMPRLVRGLGHHGVYALAFACYAAAFALFTGDLPLAARVAGGALMGCGFGLSVPLLNHHVIETSAPGELGRQLAGLALALFLGQFLAAFAERLPGAPGAGFILAILLAALVGLVHLHARLRPARRLIEASPGDH